MKGRYSQEQMRQAIARAAQLQQEVTGMMTGDEVTSIAIDAGLDGALVERALAEVVGSPIQMHTEHSVTQTVVRCELDRDLTDVELSDLSCRLGHAYGTHGRWKHHGRRSVWMANNRSLTIERTSSGALLRMEERRHHSLLQMFVAVPALASGLSLCFYALLERLSWVPAQASSSLLLTIFVVLTLALGLVTQATGDMIVRGEAWRQRLVDRFDYALRALPEPAADRHERSSDAAERERTA